MKPENLDVTRTTGIWQAVSIQMLHACCAPEKLDAVICTSFVVVARLTPSAAPLSLSMMEVKGLMREFNIV